MEKLKFALFSIVILSVLSLVGYWSVTTIQSGAEYVKTEKVKQLEKQNEDLNKETEELKSKLAVLEKKLEIQQEPQVEEKPLTEEKPTTNVSSKPTVYKNQTLIKELEKLIADNIFLKLKSQGTRVGTVQNFLNIYNKTSEKVDNDYGPGTVEDVKKFQKDQGISADGEAGAGTFRKMIEWLKKQG